MDIPDVDGRYNYAEPISLALTVFHLNRDEPRLNHPPVMYSLSEMKRGEFEKKRRQIKSNNGKTVKIV